MTKHLRTVKASLILGILIISALAVFCTPVSAERPIMFNSYISFEYDASVLNDPLEIDVSITIPFTVKYETDIPEQFLDVEIFDDSYDGSFIITQPERFSEGIIPAKCGYGFLVDEETVLILKMPREPSAAENLHFK